METATKTFLGNWRWYKTKIFCVA